MERPRLSLSCSEGSDDSGSLVASNYEYEGAVTAPATPVPPPTVTVGPIVVNAGGTGVLHGNVNTYTLNQYIVPGAGKWCSDTVNDLVTDAVQLSTDTKNKFFPKDDTQVLPGDKEQLRSLHRKWCFLISALVSLSFFILLSTLIFSIKTSRSDGSLPFFEDTSNELGMEGADLPGAPRLMSRSSWVAQPSRAPLDDNALPADTVIVCHTATESCNTTSACVLGIRFIQQFHIESRGWDDIAYNYLVGGDGCVYVGRGWDKMGAHTKGHNNSTVGVTFVGTYDNQLPSAPQMEAFDKLLDLGVRLGKLTPDYRLVAQCQLQVTAAPGAAIVRNMTSWPHYDSSLPISTCSSL